MAFENHSRTGLVERASKIALKFGVTYSVKRKMFDGATANVTKATLALDEWMHNEARVLRRNEDR
jgi:hypothetical protein